MKLVRFVAFYGSWLGSVYAPKTSQPELFSFACLIPLLVLFFYGIKNKLEVVRSLAVFAIFGLSVDSLLQAFGYFWFPQGSGLFWPLVPIWYFPFWIGFGCSMLDLEPVLRHRMWLAPILGSFGGPLSYIAGEKLGAIVILGPLWILVLIWIILLPSLTLILRPKKV